jgi:cytochrome P450
VEATIAEISRISPSAPISVPHTPVRDTELAGYSIRKVIYVVVILPMVSLMYD